MESAHRIQPVTGHAAIANSMPGFRIRNGKPADLAALCEIEARAFAADRLSRQSFRRLIGRPSAVLRAAVVDGAVVGYHLVLTRSGSAVARIYSIAVTAAARGRGIGEKLLADAERQATRRGAAVLRLEVHPGNAGAIRLYQRRGYTRIGTYRDYYADGADALRYQKTLGRKGRPGTAGAPGSGGTGKDRRPRGPGLSRPVMKLSRSAGGGFPVPSPGRVAPAALQQEA